MKFVNTSLVLKLIKHGFHLKNSSYSISIDRAIEERNSYKTLLKQKEELIKKELWGNGNSKSEALHGVKKKHEKQGEAILTKSTKNPEKLLIFYTNADNKTKKRNSIIGFDK